MSEAQLKYGEDQGDRDGFTLVNFSIYRDDPNPRIVELAALAEKIQRYNYFLRMALAGVKERLEHIVANIGQVMDRKGGA
jgi:hypothetical protein